MTPNKKLATAALTGLMTVGMMAASPAFAGDHEGKAACKNKSGCKGKAAVEKSECKGHAAKEKASCKGKEKMEEKASCHGQMDEKSSCHGMDDESE